MGYINLMTLPAWVSFFYKERDLCVFFYSRMDSMSRRKSFLAQTTGTGYKGLASFFAQVIIWSMSFSWTTSNLWGRPIFLLASSIGKPRRIQENQSDNCRNQHHPQWQFCIHNRVFPNVFLNFTCFLQKKFIIFRRTAAFLWQTSL